MGACFWMVLVGSSTSCGVVASHCGGSVRVPGGFRSSSVGAPRWFPAALVGYWSGSGCE